MAVANPLDYAFYSFEPRADQPTNYDEQTAFMESRHAGPTFCLGGNGCLAPEQMITDAITGKSTRVDEIAGSFSVIAWNGKHPVIAAADKPHPCGLESLFEFILSDGQKFLATLAHRVLTRSGWQEIGDILRESNPSLFQSSRDDQSFLYDSDASRESIFRSGGDFASDKLTACVHCASSSGRRHENPAHQVELGRTGDECRLNSAENACLSSSRKCVEHSSHKSSDCPANCLSGHHPCGEPLRSLLNISQVFSQQSADAHEQYHATMPLDDPEHTPECNRSCQCDDRLSMTHSGYQQLQCFSVETSSSSPYSRSSDSGDIRRQTFLSNSLATRQKIGNQQSPEGYGPCCTTPSSGQTAKVSASCRQAICPSGEEKRPLLLTQSRQTHDVDANDHAQCESNAPAIPLIRGCRQFELLSGRTDTIRSSSQSATLNEGVEAFDSPCTPSDSSRWIVSIRFLRRDTYWDFHVPKYENYLLSGVWHHNSGKSVCALAKAVDFMLFNEPLRKDFPFWIVSNTFEQVMEICWKEKLHEQGHLPPHLIDWGRIKWHDRKMDYPSSVPLVTYRGTNKNWRLYFKSQDQGREAFQGSSIGGFLFTEQFPHELLIEVMARCREYGGYGNKIAEFCPINPEKSFWLQEMDESGTIPDSWGLYHTNTMCAVEAGQIDANVVNDMFAMIPESMKPTRMKGLWGAYEGLVYPEFNSAIHCLPSDWEVPQACYHRRFIDWGAGPHNPFACLWACRNARGQWFVYDEYYSTEPIDAFKHLMNIQDRHPWPKHNPYYGCTWADPSEKGWIRAASEMEQYAAGYESMSIMGANNSREDGINYVKWLLDPKAALADPNGKPQPHLFVVKDNCPNLLREFRTHRYLNPPSTSGNNPRTPAAEVLKANDHALDALRYGVYSEASQQGIAPSTITKRHSASRHGIQLSSEKFDRR